MDTLNQYCKKTFGEKLYKLSLNGGMTCPNRDGTLGDRGCIFCSAGGSGDFAPAADLPLEEQIAQAKARIAPKFRGSPDCLPEEVLDLLGELNHLKPVWVELGLQTIHPKTAAYIRRGYDLPCYDRAVRELNARGIHVVTHVILGLPGESRQQMLETVDYAAQSGSGGIKLQLLHVLEGTDLAEDYRAGKFTVMTLEEYVALVSACVRRLPEDMVLHRMTGDGPKRILLAPLWSGDKKRVLNALNRALAQERRDSDVLSLSAGQ